MITRAFFSRDKKMLKKLDVSFFCDDRHKEDPS